MSKKNMGSSIDDFLKEEGIFKEAQAVKEVAAEKGGCGPARWYPGLKPID